MGNGPAYSSETERTQMNDYRQLKETLEMFLRTEVDFIFRETRAYESIKDYLPLTWQNALNPTSNSIAHIWKQSLDSVTPFYNKLQAHIHDLALVATNSNFYCAYIMKRGDEFFAFLGGIPIDTDSIANRERELGLSLPLSYQSFLFVHNGFLLDGWDSVGIQPLNKLYKIGDLLGFCGDGGGNEQCFRENDSSISNHTVDWDHETQKIGKPMTFEAFLMEFLRRNLR